ncbi:phosphonate C-P lyase system protein PhnG [Xanthobacteraceae bacterium A53D]
MAAVQRDQTDEVSLRQANMRTLAQATAEELKSAVERFRPLPPINDLRAPEVGLAMVRGRMGGDGDAFNTGEATVTRAAVRIEGGATGISYLLGRVPAEARCAAILDALWQDTALRPAVEEALAPVRERLAAEGLAAREKTEATKVNFFTMVRGED